jgi:hypothetical protein
MSGNQVNLIGVEVCRENRLTVSLDCRLSRATDVLVGEITTSPFCSYTGAAPRVGVAGVMTDDP